MQDVKRRADMLNAAADAVGQGFSLPNEWYTDPEIFRLERSTIFRNSWVYFGHESELAAPSSYLARTAGTDPVVVTRTADGDLNGFLNVCRHRLHKVATGCGEATGLVCRYHGWRYGLDGSLQGVPRSAEVYEGDGQQFPTEQFGLIEVSVAQWGPLIFVNTAQDARPFEEEFGEVIQHAAANGVNFDTVPMWRDETVIPCNWKTMVDNVIECYHCSLVHPEFSRNFDTSAKAAKLQMYGDSCVLELPRRGVRGKDADQSAYHAYFLPPTTYLTARGDLWYFIVSTEPVGESSTRVVSHFMAPADMPQEERDELIAGAALVNEQDAVAAATVQTGYELNPDFVGYQMPHSEAPLRAFAKFVVDAVAKAQV